MLRKKMTAKGAGLMVLVVAMISAGIYIYLRGFASAETISRTGCTKLVEESNWRLSKNACLGPNGVVLTINQDTILNHQ